jgi:hypothetical protein
MNLIKVIHLAERNILYFEKAKYYYSLGKNYLVINASFATFSSQII